ncbi:TIGR02302 family protein [Aquicoccus porphyridii]|uniref:TIGR02302 family protein n=1 Tax=Aquicoccus porphyridii TaxID=1852029 RepID=UPI003514C2B2
MANRTGHEILSRLRWPIGLTRYGMVAERGTRAFWPFWSLAMAVLGVLMLGLHDMVPVEAVWAGAVVTLVAGLALLVRGVRAFRLPREDEVLARLDATMAGRPIQALMDAQAIGAGDPASRAVWEAHQGRMRARAETARAVRPDLRVSARDPYGLRYMAALVFLVALLFGSLVRVGSVADMTPGVGSAEAAIGPSWEGWIAPPGYTGRPTLYLNDLKAGEIAAPEGSRITLRLYGPAGALRVIEDVSGAPVRDAEAAETESEPAQDFALARAGSLAIEGPGGRRWDMALIPDMAPQIDATGPAEASAVGDFTMPFEARDDYGVTAGRARITLDEDRVDRRYGLAIEPEPRDAIEVPLPLPVARGREDFEDVLIEDFSQHPWANLPVKLELRAEDAGGNLGQSPVQEIDLAARRFFDPMAAVVVEMRRDLLWNRDNARRIAQVLRAVSYKPEEGMFDRESDYLRLRFILRRIETGARYGMSDETRDEIAEALWDLALLLEEGTLADALERMRQAQERLREAMKNGASEAEIARLMDELREATRDYLEQLQREFAEQNQRDGTDQPDQGESDENTMTMTQDDLQRMMDRIQELMEQGRMAEAQQALEELQQMMENMRMTEGQGGQGGQSPGQQAMEGLAETLRDQQGLSDQAFRDLQEQFNPGANSGQSRGNEGRSGGMGRGEQHEGEGEGQSGEPGQQGEGQRPGQQGGPQDLGESLAERQNQLRRQLDQQRGALPGAGTPGGDAARESLDRAGRAMDGAEEALREGDLAEAIDRQAEAMDNLRDGMRELGEQMAEEQRNNPGQQGQAADAMPGQNRSDPLGRNQRGAAGVEDNMLQGEDVYRRARDLLDELRRRSGETARPETERNYIERLLDRF